VSSFNSAHFSSYVLVVSPETILTAFSWTFSIVTLSPCCQGLLAGEANSRVGAHIVCTFS
jgi:hypothetical protein